MYTSLYIIYTLTHVNNLFAMIELLSKIINNTLLIIIIKNNNNNTWNLYMILNKLFPCGIFKINDQLY